ncbi:MAG: DUF3857 domain-containing protein [Bacteroidales bacterium]|jgi:hypothetical protein|nr:DUF3857 domain-containing protein [Bacteroidales bacterium]
MRRLLLFIFCYPIFSTILHAQEYDQEILSHVSYLQASESKLICMDTVVRQINTRMGESMAKVMLPYNKMQKLTIGDAWIEDRHGRIIRKLKKSEISDESTVSNSSLYEDEFVKSFILKHNDYPYRIIYSYKIVLTDFLQILAFEPTYRVPIRKKKIVLDIPFDYQIRYKHENVSFPVIDTIGNRIRMEWNTTYTPVKREKDAPFSESKTPIIHIVPVNFKYGIRGSWENWQTFGDWVYRLNAKSGKLPETEKSTVDRLLQGTTDVREKIKLLYHYLQDNTRYINVKINVGGLKAYPASYVSANKYGDCKALCNYMQALLTYAGIPSYYTLVRAENEVFDIDKTFPSQAFNHIILTIPLVKDTLFLECTNKNIPAGYLGTFTQGRDVLIIDGLNSRFVKTPSLQPDEVLCERMIHTSLATSSIPATLTMKQRGEDYEYFTFLSSQLNRNDAEIYIRNHVLSGTFTLSNITFEKLPREIPEINIIAQLNMPDVCRKYGNNILINSFPHDLPAYEHPEKRTQGVRFDYPVYYRDSIVYHFTDDIKVNMVPQNISAESKYGHYMLKYKIADEKLIMEKEILINKGIYPLSEYGDFYSFISEIKNNEKKNTLIN